MPTGDPPFGRGTIRADGREMLPMHLFVVEAPSASRYPRDDDAYMATMPAGIAFRPLAGGGCPLVTAR